MNRRGIAVSKGSEPERRTRLSSRTARLSSGNADPGSWPAAIVAQAATFAYSRYSEDEFTSLAESSTGPRAHDMAGWRGSVAAGASAIQGIGFCLEVATGVEEEKSYSSSLKLPRARDPDSCAARKPGDPGVLPHRHTCRTRLIAGFAGVSVITFEIAVFARDQAPASAVFCLQNAEEADLGAESPWSAAISMRACALARNSGP